MLLITTKYLSFAFISYLIIFVFFIGVLRLCTCNAIDMISCVYHLSICFLFASTYLYYCFSPFYDFISSCFLTYCNNSCRYLFFFFLKLVVKIYGTHLCSSQHSSDIMPLHAKTKFFGNEAAALQTPEL